MAMREAPSVEPEADGVRAGGGMRTGASGRSSCRSPLCELIERASDGRRWWAAEDEEDEEDEDSEESVPA